AGLSRRKFVLIQGPPGTGKTQTILGLLSAILHATPARIHTKGKMTEIKRAPDLDFQEKYVFTPAIVLDLNFYHASCFLFSTF
nr:probable helicase MAGATAMA 3 [Tanacetum cinerariifolium]